MSAFLPKRVSQGIPEPDHPKLQQEPASPAEQRARWQVRAAQWRAHELAHLVFGGVSDMGLIGMRLGGEMRGLLRLDVPFDDLDLHRDREARFMAAVATDPLLSSVPLLYVIGPSDAAATQGAVR
jgi:hypothetical protein